jgi:hypothetical protein
MIPGDKDIWDATYDEEFDGLASLPNWQVITEDQFQQLSKGVKVLPTMAIITIKYDSHNRLKWAEYQIVVFGNLDYHNWSKESTAAPVMSQLELHVLMSLAVFCPRSTPGTYWRLIRSLYGLRWAPKLRFEIICSHLKAMGLHCSDASPCLFVGTLIEGEPPIYVGIYVEDIIYYSTSDAVERKFESLLTTIEEVEFTGQVTQFLGIEFTWKASSKW